MGLYLCIFDEGDEELDGVEVGSYSDWGAFINAVVGLEGRRGSRHPLLTMHSDSDGEWSVEECRKLGKDLEDIAAAFKQSPPLSPTAGSWQAKVARQLGLRFETLYDSFVDIDGENLIERLKSLAELAQKVGRPILFQ